MLKKWIIMVKFRERKVFKFVGKKSNSEKYSRLNIWKIFFNYKIFRNIRWIIRMFSGVYNKGKGIFGRKKWKGIENLSSEYLLMSGCLDVYYLC